MPSNKQRRETTRRNLELQLQQRQAREAQRKRATLIGSIVGSILVIALVVVIIAVVAGGNATKKPNQAAGAPSTSARPTTVGSSAAAPAPPAMPPAPCAAPPKTATAAFKGVTVGQATNLKHEPKVAAKATVDPTALECADLVLGKGAAAQPGSQVTVQYTGVLYRNGMQFDSSWARGGKPAQFSLAQVIPGFTQGIGGTGMVVPMRVGGRRIMVLPPSLAYGAQAQQSIPANSTLVFVVDLVKIG